MFIKPPIHQRRNLAFTLVEVMIALGLSSLVVAVIATATFYSTRSMVGLLNYSELNRKSMHALDIMTRDIRQMRNVESLDTNVLSLREVTTNATNYLVYRWDPTTRELRRSLNGTVDVLLQDCHSLNFQGYKRNPKTNEYTSFYPETENEELIKMIQVDWVCFRDVMKGDKRTTESVQTAKIVIRAQ